MKHLTFIFTFTFLLHLSSLSASAAVPLRWTVETSRAQPATFEAYQGETLDFEATLQSYGKPLEAPVQYAFYWQTNGMGSAYWSVSCASASSPTNVLRATWTPSMETGARAYNCFIGLSNSIYHAAFQLRLRPSPGAVPNELPFPQKVIDFSKVTVLNPPWSGGGGSGGVDTNAVIDIANATIATNATISGKRDKTDEAAYDIVWECTPGMPPGVVFGWFNDGNTIGWGPLNEESKSTVGRIKGDESSTELSWIADEWVYDYPFTAVKSIRPSSTQKLARRATSATSALAKFDADGNLVADNSGKGLSSNDYTDDDKAEVAKVEGKADEFTEWDFVHPDVFSGLHIEVETVGGQKSWTVYQYELRLSVVSFGDGKQTELTFIVDEYHYITAIRKRVLRTGDAATTNDLSAAISTNNPAFVSAVRSTPPDPETPWGTYGTLGAAIAGIIAALATKLTKGLDAQGVPTDANVQELFSESNTLFKRGVRYAHSTFAFGSGEKLKDRAINALTFTTSSASHTFDLAAALPTVTDGCVRDFLVRLISDAKVTFETGTMDIRGDGLAMEDGAADMLITLTEIASGVWYVRSIDITAQTEA